MPISRSAQDLIELEIKLKNRYWYHAIDLGGGVATPGRVPLQQLAQAASLFFDPLDLSTKSVLDVGTWDGGYAVEAKRRGAKRVLATDSFIWTHKDFLARANFDLVMAETGLDIEAQEIDVPDLTRDAVGGFDVVLFAGVLYHLFDPIQAVRQLAEIANEVMIVETHVDALDYSRPVMVMYPGAELGGDPTNWWGPNPACMEAMLKTVGFARIDFILASPTRGIFHAWK